MNSETGGKAASRLDAIVRLATDAIVTADSQRAQAEQISEILNSYLSEMAKIADEYGGTIDKFIGDGVMIFFGDADTKGRKNDALACVRMALEMRHRTVGVAQGVG